MIGNDYSIADICIAPVLQRLEDLGMAKMWTASRPRGVSDWYERIRGPFGLSGGVLSGIAVGRLSAVHVQTEIVVRQANL